MTIYQYCFTIRMDKFACGTGTGKLVLEICPPPYVYVVVPFNLIWNHVKNSIPLKDFEKKYHMKSESQGGDFSGSTVKKIIHNENIISELEEFVGPK